MERNAAGSMECTECHGDAGKEEATAHMREGRGGGEVSGKSGVMKKGVDAIMMNEARHVKAAVPPSHLPHHKRRPCLPPAR